MLLSSVASGQSAVASITAGDSVTGSLSANDSRTSDGKPFRVYRFEGAPGKRYFVELHSSVFDAYLRVGRIIAGITDYIGSDDDSGDGTDAQVNVRATDRGAYVIVVTSADDTTAKGGAFTLHLTERVDRAVDVRPITIGDSIAGALDQNSATWRNSQFPYAVYTFRAQKGQRVIARLHGPSAAADVDFGRMTSTGYSPLPGSSGVARFREFMPPDDGEYAVRVMTTKPTSYVLSLSRPVPEPVRNARIGVALTGTLDSKTAGEPAPHHSWILRAVRSQRFAIALNSGMFDPALVLNRRTGDTVVFIARNDNAPGLVSNSRIEISAPVSGEYEIRVEAADSAGGDYTLRVDTLARTQVQFRRSTIASGQEVRGTLSETDSTLEDGSPFQEWVYEAKPKERVVFTLRSPDFDTFLSIGRMQGGKFAEFASNDDAPGDTTDNRVSRVMIIAPAPGPFIVRANSMAINQRGSFTLRAGPEEIETRIGRAINTAHRAQLLARQSLITRAIATIDSALALDSSHVTSEHLNTICWFGSLRNYAAHVISYCERAVRLDPTDTGVRDSRGVARALTGNVAGAIEDFTAYSGDSTKDNTSRNQRRAWVAALQAGTQPAQVFSDAVRETLLR
jgi:hypothetical protein